MLWVVRLAVSGLTSPTDRGGPRAWERMVASLFFHLLKPLPDGISAAGPLRSAEGMEFLADLTFQGGERQGGAREVVDQQIFDRVLSMIDAAEDFVVIDMFLFNGGHDGERDYRPLSEELTNHLILKKASNPDLDLIFITDEINNLYGAYTGPEIARLQAAGVEVVLTRMTRLRDSNPVYSAGWRMLVGWLGTGGPGWLPDVINRSGRKVTARAYLKLLNLKANHRKTHRHGQRMPDYLRKSSRWEQPSLQYRFCGNWALSALTFWRRSGPWPPSQLPRC